MKKWILIGIGFILLITAFFINVYLNAMDPLKTAEQKAIAAANKKADIKSVQDVQIYNGSETFFIVQAKDNNDSNIIVWVPEKGGNIIISKASDGISKQEAIGKLLQEKNPKEIIAVRLAMLKTRQCWEIYYLSHNNLINYYYIDFETGEWLRQIENM